MLLALIAVTINTYRAQTGPLDAIRAWLTREIEVSSPRPVFASSSGCGDWWRFSCHRRLPGFRPPNGTARLLHRRPREFWGLGTQATKISFFHRWRWR